MADKSSPRKTPLAARHEALGARMVEFGGWLMPVQYSGILQEHHAVRAAAGLFDISHMGEFIISGPSAEAWLNTVLTNDIRAISPEHGQYTLMTSETGGVVDDLFIYRLEDQAYLAIVNAAQIDQDFNWLQKRLGPNVTLKNASDDYAALALQGPKAEPILYRVFNQEPRRIKRNQLMFSAFRDQPALIARTGYTGEEGYELFVPAAVGGELWDRLLAAGAEFGCVPAGLGARDTLRLEAGYPLYGHELNPSVSPLEAGLGFFVSFDKPERFVGRESLRAQKTAGPARRGIAFAMSGPSAPPRAGYAVYAGDEKIGEVTSGGVSPTLKKNIGLALVASPHAKAGGKIEIEIRDRRCPALIVKKPFYNNIQKS
jgi:aminomethyltransferase